MIADTITIIGVGLIGGSLAKALKQTNSVAHVVGYDIDESSLQDAMQLGIIDSYHLDIQEAVKDADIIVLALPLSAVDCVFSSIGTTINESVVITDVCSVKSAVTDSARVYLGSAFSRFVPGHPIAGRETYGVQAATAKLFTDHRVILTPVMETETEALQLIKKMWTNVGADVCNLTAKEHDSILAATSHLPHMLAYALVDCLSGLREQDGIFKFVAGGFTDFTRIASSNPQMWHDICFSNRKELLAAIEQYSQHLDKIMEALKCEDSEALLAIFQGAKHSRDSFIQRKKNSQSLLDQ